MIQAAVVHARWLALGAIAGTVIGAAGTSFGWATYLSPFALAAGEKPSCSRKQQTPEAKGSAAVATDSLAPKCPVHYGDNDLVIDDPVRAERLRQATFDGIFTPWLEVGRAPTPEEFGQRLKISSDEAESLLDQMQACGEARAGGILRVPQSELIAVAWPLANVPTGITVSIESGKPAFARCAIDALGVSKMLGKQVTVEGTSRDNGAGLRIVVNGEKVVSVDPPGVVVLRGDCCDQMSFFSSQLAAKAWQTAHDGAGRLLSLDEAVLRGAKTFGRYAKKL